MATERVKAVHKPDDAPLPESLEDLAWAIFCDAARKGKAKTS